MRTPNGTCWVLGGAAGHGYLLWGGLGGGRYSLALPMMARM